MDYFKENYDTTTTGFAIAGIIATCIVMIFVLPWLGFWLAYFGGWIAKITIGGVLVKGLALIGLNITPDKIPLLSGALGWIGGFFKSITSTVNK
jgi:hypothetical protein